MTFFFIRIRVLPEKRKELLQTVEALVDQVRNQSGCVNAALCQDVQNDNAFILLTEWRSRKDLENHIRSDRFSILLGASSLMEQPLAMEILPASHLSGTKACLELRRQPAENPVFE